MAAPNPNAPRRVKKVDAFPERLAEEYAQLLRQHYRGTGWVMEAARVLEELAKRYRDLQSDHEQTCLCRERVIYQQAEEREQILRWTREVHRMFDGLETLISRPLWLPTLDELDELNISSIDERLAPIKPIHEFQAAKA